MEEEGFTRKPGIRGAARTPARDQCLQRVAKAGARSSWETLRVCRESSQDFPLTTLLTQRDLEGLVSRDLSGKKRAFSLLGSFPHRAEYWSQRTGLLLRQGKNLGNADHLKRG